MFKSIMQTAAFGIVAMLALDASNALAQDGPFGINPGDEMPSTNYVAPGEADEPGEANETVSYKADRVFGLPSAIVEPPRGYDAMSVYGTDNIGICALGARKESEPVVLKHIQDVFSDKYGQMFDNEEASSNVPFLSHGVQGAFHWRPSGGDVAEIVVADVIWGYTGWILIYYVFVNFDEYADDYYGGL